MHHIVYGLSDHTVLSHIMLMDAYICGENKLYNYTNWKI
jgi:hypothetical protein